MTETLDLADARTAELYRRLAPFARGVLEATSRHALRLHAEEIVPEHLLTTLMEDEDSAAHRAVLFAFADPQTIAGEALALSPGILVVSSAHSLPFSPVGVEALFSARARAIEEGAEVVSARHLFAAAFEALTEELRERLAASGLDPERLRESSGDGTIAPDGPLFASFDEETRRILGVSCKVARQAGRSAISPAHLLTACVSRQKELAERAGTSAPALGTLIGAADEDATLPTPRTIPLDPVLEAFLAAAPESASGVDTLDLLRNFAERGADEVRDILRRNRINGELLDRVRASYVDPAG